MTQVASRRHASTRRHFRRNPGRSGSRLWLGLLLLSGLAVALPGDRAAADPCGMVPPLQITTPGAITRIGLQQTYVFYKDGVESFVIRPGFEGKVEEFGMLIPFPKPPALRKVGDEIFPHVCAAIDPPEVVLDLRPMLQYQHNAAAGPMNTKELGDVRLRDEVRVINQEAVGMYEVAVLDAGSAAALRRWMDDHQYRFPDGMEAICEEYVQLRWCFVAVKTRVSGKASIDPAPGMRTTQPGLPAGSSFEGAVQGMGFRFQTDELVVPMRLSAFNAGELRNVVYLLTDSPQRIRAIPEEYVVRQISGDELFKHVTQPLPLRIVGGTEKDINAGQLEWLKTARDPAPRNGLAADLFAGDLLASSSGKLSHAHEEREKMLLRIGEGLNLRGPEIDALDSAALSKERKSVQDVALRDLTGMTLTVVDGDFPREVLGSNNLTFAEYQMPARRNNAASYDCTTHAPGQRGANDGTLIRGALGSLTPDSAAPLVSRGMQLTLSLGITILLLGGILLRSRRRS